MSNPGPSSMAKPVSLVLAAKFTPLPDVLKVAFVCARPSSVCTNFVKRVISEVELWTHEKVIQMRVNASGLRYHTTSARRDIDRPLIVVEVSREVSLDTDEPRKIAGCGKIDSSLGSEIVRESDVCSRLGEVEHVVLGFSRIEISSIELECGNFVGTRVLGRHPWREDEDRQGIAN
jgi:hypothetical protein